MKIIATLSLLVVLATSASATIIDNDTYTTDTISGLDWLDITASTGRSFDYVSSRFDSGEEFDGWRYATSTEISGFFDAFGGSGTYDGFSTANNGLFDKIAPLWGDAYFNVTVGLNPGDGFQEFWYKDESQPNDIAVGEVYDLYTNSGSLTQDSFRLYFYTPTVLTKSSAYRGAALVRLTYVSDLPSCNDRDNPPTGGGIPPRCRPPGLPEPAIPAMIIFGIIGMGLLRRRSESHAQL